MERLAIESTDIAFTKPCLFYKNGLIFCYSRNDLLIEIVFWIIAAAILIIGLFNFLPAKKET